MTSNFFDDLERQLVAATTDRPRRLRRARNRTIATLCTAVIAVLAAGGGLAAALSTGGDNTTNNSAPAAETAPPVATLTSPTTSTSPQRNVPLPAPGTFEVAVLNGTTTPGLARGVAMQLQSHRLKIGTVTNAASPDATATIVYAANPNTFAAAVETVQALGRLTHHQPRMAPESLRALAGQQASVIVVVGSSAAIRR
jgi:hypothetical protein